MKDLPKLFTEMILKDANNKITQINEISNYLTQYSQANTFLIPKKYKETITNELTNLTTPIVYDIKVADENMIIITLLNFGAVQRENLLQEMKKHETDNNRQ